MYLVTIYVIMCINCGVICSTPRKSQDISDVCLIKIIATLALQSLTLHFYYTGSHVMYTSEFHSLTTTVDFHFSLNVHFKSAWFVNFQNMRESLLAVRAIAAH